MKRDTDKEPEKHPPRPAREESRAPDIPRADAFSLQRHAGNQAVLNLLHPDAAQSKVRISQPNDADEREASHTAELFDAERTAEANPRVSAAAKSQERSANAAPPAASSSSEAPSDVAAQFSPALNSGQPLDPGLRKTMEAKLGGDFRNVRIHSGEAAKAASKSLDARAFTVGSHVVFNAGEFAPSSRSGRKLIAHELAHVSQNQKAAVQGNASAGAAIKRESIIGKASSYLSEKKEQAGKAIDAKKWEIYRGMIAGMKAGKNYTVGKLRALVPKLPHAIQGAASGIIDSFDFTVDIIYALLLAIVGLAVGFVSGIVDLVVGLVKLVVGLFQLFVDAFVAMLGQPEDLQQDWRDLSNAVQRIPQGLKQLVNDWLERYKHATLEEQVLMGGELVGQIEAFIATFALAGTKAGQAGNLAIRAEVNVPKLVRFAGGPLDVALTTAPKTVTATIPAVVPATAAQVAVVSSQTMMMAAHGSQGGPGGSSGGGSGSGGGSHSVSDPADPAPTKKPGKAPKSGEKEPEPPKSDKPRPKADAESDRLQQKYSSRSKTKYPSIEWKRIEQLEQRFPKLKSARLRPYQRPGVADEAIFEERMLTTQGKYSLAAYSEDGEMVIQFDGISPEGFVEEVKIEQSADRVSDIVTQLRRQADFAQNYGLKGVEYSVSPPSVAELVEQQVAAERLRGVYRARGF
jgi:hypothetical protein